MQDQDASDNGGAADPSPAPRHIWYHGDPARSHLPLVGNVTVTVAAPVAPSGVTVHSTRSHKARRRLYGPASWASACTCWYVVSSVTYQCGGHDGRRLGRASPGGSGAAAAPRSCGTFPSPRAPYRRRTYHFEIGRKANVYDGEALLVRGRDPPYGCAIRIATIDRSEDARAQKDRGANAAGAQAERPVVRLRRRERRDDRCRPEPTRGRAHRRSQLRAIRWRIRRVVGMISRGRCERGSRRRGGCECAIRRVLAKETEKTCRRRWPPPHPAPPSRRM
jgi:hypothetical protein